MTKTSGAICALLVLLGGCAVQDAGFRPAPVTPAGRDSPGASPLGSGDAPSPDSPQSGKAGSAAPGGEPVVRVAVKGDWGYGSEAQREITAQMCLADKSEAFEAVATTGDNFYRPDGVATENNYYGPEACLINRPEHTWRPTWGNHDVASESTATVLGAEARWYAWKTGNAEFFMLDSNQAAAGSQAAWLASALEASQAGAKIAVFHHPPFTVGKHENNADVTRNWVSLFERHSVDLVVSGHNHAYEHSVVNEIDYVITGGGGAPLYPCVRNEPWLLKCRVVYHFVLLEATSSQIAVRAVDQAGSVVDEFMIAV